MLLRGSDAVSLTGQDVLTALRWPQVDRVTRGEVQVHDPPSCPPGIVRALAFQGLVATAGLAPRAAGKVARSPGMLRSRRERWGAGA